MLGGGDIRVSPLLTPFRHSADGSHEWENRLCRPAAGYVDFVVANGGLDGWIRHRMLPAELGSTRAARETVRVACRDWRLDDHTCDDALLVATELVANAVDHAQTPCVLTVSRDHDGLRITVRDFAPRQLPELQPVDVTASRGRGLQVVAAVSSEWGVTTVDGEKSVWAVLAEGAGA
jgi:anti-sigma regulatory factor (Ser/Thr protein kinase)